MAMFRVIDGGTFVWWSSVGATGSTPAATTARRKPFDVLHEGVYVWRRVPTASAPPSSFKAAWARNSNVLIGAVV